MDELCLEAEVLVFHGILSIKYYLIVWLDTEARRFRTENIRWLEMYGHTGT